MICLAETVGHGDRFDQGKLSCARRAGSAPVSSLALSVLFSAEPAETKTFPSKWS